MAISRQQAEAHATGLGVASLSAVLTSAPLNGNVMYAFASHNLATSDAVKTGWVTVATATNASGSALRLFRKVCGAAESATQTVTSAGGTLTCFSVIEYTGVDTTTPEDVAASTNAASTTNAVATGVSDVTTGSLLLAGCAEDAGVTLTKPASMGNASNLVSGAPANLTTCDETSDTATNRTYTNALTDWASIMVRLRPTGTTATTTVAATGLPLSRGLGFTPFVGQTFDQTPTQTSFDTGAPPVPAPLRQGIFGALVGQVVPNDIGSAGGGLTDTFSFSTTGASAPSFTLAGMTDTFTVSTTGSSVPTFTLAGMTDTFVLATTGTSAPVFTLAGMTDTFVVSTTGKSAPVFTLAGMSDVFSFASTGRSVPAFVVAGMSDVLSFAPTGTSAPVFAVVSIAGGGNTDIFTFAATGSSTAQFGLIFFTLNREGDRVSREAGLGLGSMYEYANYSTATSASLAEHSRVNAGVGLGAGSHIDFTNAAARTDEPTTEGNRVRDLAGIGGGSQANL